jgi:hypothetical protein
MGIAKNKLTKKKCFLPSLTLMREGRRGFICYVMKSPYKRIMAPTKSKAY